RLLARMTDVILTVNEEQRQELIGFGIAPSEKIQSMPLGLDLRPLAEGAADPAVMRRKWGVDPEAPLVGIVARLVPVKGHELFIDAAAELLQRRPEVRFAIIGDGERRQELERYTRERQVPVLFTGWESDLPAVYAALDIACLT